MSWRFQRLLAHVYMERIGVGALHTTVEFKDVRGTHGGQTLFASDFSSSAEGWSGGARWVVKDGVYVQTDASATAVSFAGDNSWRDYTLSLRARKANGYEGFLVMVRGLDAENYIAWNLGGWGNRFHGIISRLGQQDRLVGRVPGSIEPGRWYDIKIVLNGTHLECYLDGKLLQSAVVPVLHTPTFFASATRDERAGEIIIKAVNPTGEPAETTVKVRGVKRMASDGQCILLTGTGPADENSFDRPKRVAPVTSTLQDVEPEFNYTFQPYSMTVLRLPAARY